MGLFYFLGLYLCRGESDHTVYETADFIAPVIDNVLRPAGVNDMMLRLLCKKLLWFHHVLLLCRHHL